MTKPTSTPTPMPLLPFMRVLVWDAPVRICHALMVACFTGAYLTAEQEEWRKVHATLGYTLGGLAVFRIIWGFVGTRYARFSNFVRGPGAVAEQLRRLPHGWAKRHLGHSPVAALFIVVMLLLTLAVVASGWASSATPEAEWLNELHEIAASATLAVGALYFAGVAIGSWRAGESLTLSMIRGTKLGLAEEAIRSARRGVALLLLAAVVAFWWYQWKGADNALPDEQVTPIADVHRPPGGGKP